MLFRKKRLIWQRIYNGLLLLAGINFVIWWHMTLFLGGTPDYEKSYGGKYYLSNHSRLTEVTEERFISVEYYTICTWGLNIFAMVVFVLSTILEEGLVFRLATQGERFYFLRNGFKRLKSRIYGLFKIRR